MWLFWIALVIALALVARGWLRGGGTGESHETPLDILKRRYARGEIDRSSSTRSGASSPDASARRAGRSLRGQREREVVMYRLSRRRRPVSLPVSARGRAAADRGIELAESLRLPCDLDGWRATREELRGEIDRRGVDPERGCHVQSFESRELDASLLLLPIVGYVDAGDPRMRATVASVERELGVDGTLVRRYRAGLDDGVSGEEGYFLMASFWLVEVLAMQGRLEEAEARFRRLVELGNDVQLFAEEYHPRAGHLGNFSQAFTHVAIIGAAQQLADARSRGSWGRTGAGHRAGIRRSRREAR